MKLLAVRCQRRSCTAGSRSSKFKESLKPLCQGRERSMAQAVPAFLVDLPRHVPDWNGRRHRDGRAVAVSGPRKARGATLRGCELSEKEGCLFEGEKDALIFYPPLELAAKATIAVEVKPRTLTKDERWLVLTYGKGARGESAHICLLQTGGQQLLGLWDGDAEQWHACEPEYDVAPKGSGFLRIVAHVEQAHTTFYVDGVLKGAAPHAVRASILGCGNVPLCDRPKSSSRKQVVGWIRRLEVYAGVINPAHCFPAVFAKARPALLAPCLPAAYETGSKPEVMTVVKKRRHIVDDAEADPPKKQKKKQKQAPELPAPPMPRTRDPAQLVAASCVLAEHGEEEAFLEAVQNAPRRNLWLSYDPKPPTDAKSLDAFLRARPHRTVFKFKGEDAPAFGLGALGAELEAASRRSGGSAAMQILRDRSQMSTLFAPTGAGDTDWNHAKTSIEVSFDGFIRSALQADRCRRNHDTRGLEVCVEKGSAAQKVTEWKPAFLRRSGTAQSTGLLPPWFESVSWLTKLKKSDAEVFRPKFALMQAGACTAHHRDNYGTLTWIKVLGGSQLLATWNMADGDSTPGLSDTDEDSEDFPWATFVDVPSARMVLLDVGDVFFMRPGVYHRVFTLSAKVQLFGEFVGACTFVESLKSAKADRERPHCLKACDDSITMTSLFLAGLSAELDGHVDEVTVAAALALGGVEALRALRSLPDKCLDACSRAVGFDADAACQALLGCPGL